MRRRRARCRGVGGGAGRRVSARAPVLDAGIGKKEKKEKKEKVVNTVDDLDADLDSYIKGRAATDEAPPAAQPVGTAVFVMAPLVQREPVASGSSPYSGGATKPCSLL